MLGALALAGAGSKKLDPKAAASDLLLLRAARRAPLIVER
jgi:hypothetical protein